ncbi:DEAD/DEAH box helicase [Mumia sp. DW29H23]|uniref:DEAD/DEAH box helicase n=1 Tax=Mumia sp. DW29H23 TaxID=3421241 RepID=UPI003D6903CD
MRLVDHLPAAEESDDADVVFDAFSTWAEGEGLTLYPAQEDALIELVSGSNVILATPTGSGKSLVAAGAQFAALAKGRRSFYTAPIKALVSEKFFALVDMFGADKVGMMTGDASVNADAPIIAATAEILANKALREGAAADVGLVVMDEFHFYSEPDRGWAWEVPLLELPHAQFLLMSATLGDTGRFEKDLTERTGRETTLVAGTERPVPLVHEYVTTPVHETVEELLATGQAPIYVVHFTQASAIERAQALSSINVTTRAEKDTIAAEIGDFKFQTGFGKTLSRLVRMGIGVHHAGMLPRYRRLVERLTQKGLLKVVCGTDTLGVGINVPIRTVLFSGLSKYDGVRQRHLHVREFQQIAGRAGRAGYDTIGRVVVQAPEHEVENAKMVRKAGDDPKKLRKIQRKKPPEGFVNWSDRTFDKLSTGQPEPLASRMRTTHAMVLNLVARPGDARAAVRSLVTDSHATEADQERMLAEADAIFQTLIDGGVVEELAEPDAEGRTVRLTVDLQEDFALNQPLAPFAVAALEILDPDSPTYALEVVSVFEAILEDPRPIISAQRNRAKGEAVAEMKAEGLEYEERMELLEEVEHPQPLRDELEVAYAAYRTGHPWVADHELKPKSVAREMWERSMTFAEYVSLYQLARSEGLVLRYLSDVYRTLRHTVPDSFATDEIDDITDWLGEVVRQTDSSLLDEWEALAAGEGGSVDVVIAQHDAVDTGPPPVTANERAFRVLVRNALFRRVELMALRRWIDLGAMDEAAGWTAEVWREAVEDYFAEYDTLGTGPDARGPAMLVVDTDPEGAESRVWHVRQILDDPEGDRDWAIFATVHLDASDEAGEAVVQITDVGPQTDATV